MFYSAKLSPSTPRTSNLYLIFHTMYIFSVHVATELDVFCQDYTRTGFSPEGDPAEQTTIASLTTCCLHIHVGYLLDLT